MIIHDILFDDISARYDLGLHLTEMIIGSPKPRRTLVTVPGANGSLDLTNAISPYIQYDDRKLEFKFVILNERKNWSDVISQLTDIFHGQKYKVITGDDPDWYWDAYVEVDTFASTPKKGEIVLAATCYPYKRKIAQTTKTVTLTAGTNTINLANSRMEVTPKIINTAAVVITEWNGAAVSIALAAGTHTLADHVLESGANVIKMTGTGTVTIEYQEGKL